MSRAVRLVVPGLPPAPFVGGGCCGAVPAQEVISEQLSSWPGVLGVEVDVERGVVEVALGPHGPADGDLVGTLSGLGYDVESLTVAEVEGR